MKPFKRVTIIGVGLIGGSIGLAIKKRRLAREVVGVFRRSSTLAKALRRRAVDRGVMTVAEGVRGSDLIIVATPVGLIPTFVGEAARHAEPAAIITDAGSTKTWIAGAAERAARRYGPVRFVGSHPMAGSEETGVGAARPDLLQDAPCIVTKTPATDRRALAAVVRFWKALGCDVSVMTPAAHDRSVSFVSHLPHLVAYGLAGAVPEGDLRYAAEGFRDTTRVASSDPELWADIFLSNRGEIARAMRAFETRAGAIAAAIAQNDRALLVRLLGAAKKRRDRFVYRGR